jgi:hypothetical protein
MGWRRGLFPPDGGWLGVGSDRANAGRGSQPAPSGDYEENLAGNAFLA